MDVHSSNNYNYLKKLQKVSNETKKDIYAIFDNGVIIYNRNSKDIELYGNIKKFIPTI